MSATWKLYAVTGAVVASSLALLAALTFSLSQSSWKRGSRWVEIDFPDATGIRPHGPVRYAGALAGEVVYIRFLTAEERLAQSGPENAVRVTARLQDDVLALPVGVLATLSSESIMGEKFIALAAGSPDAPELANGSIIQGEAMVTFDQVAKSAVDVTENLNSVLARLTLDYGQLVSEIHDVLGQGGAVLGDGRQLLSRLDSTAENLDHIVAGIKIDYPGWAAQLDAFLKDGGALAKDSRAMMGKVNGMIESADHLITSSAPRISELLSQLQVVAQNPKVVSTYGKALTANLGEKPSRLIWGGRNKFALPSEQEILTSEDPVPIERRR